MDVWYRRVTSHVVESARKEFNPERVTDPLCCQAISAAGLSALAYNYDKDFFLVSTAAIGGELQNYF